MVFDAGWLLLILFVDVLNLLSYVFLMLTNKFKEYNNALDVVDNLKFNIFIQLYEGWINIIENGDIN